MNPPASLRRREESWVPGGARRAARSEAAAPRWGFYGSEWRTGPGAPDGLGYQPRIPPVGHPAVEPARSVSPRSKARQAGRARRPVGGKNEEARPIGTTAQTRVGEGARRPSRAYRRSRGGRRRERRDGGARPRAGRGPPWSGPEPPGPSALCPETTFFSPAQPPVTGSAQKPVMILPQVHLRKPCYDFYFL